jgi:hypothetical protein
MSRCADYLLFRHYTEVDQVRLHAARFCCLPLLCPFCAIRRGSKALGAYLTKWEAVRLSRPDLRAFLVTLTVRNGPELAERFRHVKAAHARLWKRREHRDYRTSVMAGVAGGVWSYEFKRGKGSGQWHPHVHGIWLARERPDAFQLSYEWQQLTGDSKIVDVRPIDEADQVAGFCEVFKYAVKFSDMEPADTWHGYQTLRGARLVDAAGVLRGVDIPDSLLDDPLEGPYVERLFRFLRGRGYQEARGYGGGQRPMEAATAA